MNDGMQDELFDELDAELFLMPPAVRAARCTGKQAAKIEQVLILVRKLVAYGCPVAEITRDAKISERVVNAVILQDLEAATANRKNASETLRRLGARWLGKAITKERDADFKDLVTAGNQMMQRAAETVAGIGVGTEEKSAAQILTDEEQKTGTLDELRQMLGLPAAPSNTLVKDSVESLAIEQVTEAPTSDIANTDGQDRGGGGSLPTGDGGIPLHQSIAEFSAEILATDQPPKPASDGAPPPVDAGLFPPDILDQLATFEEKTPKHEKGVDPSTPL